MSDAVGEVKEDSLQNDVKCPLQPFYKLESSSGTLEKTSTNLSGNNSQPADNIRRRKRKRTRRGKPRRRQIRPYTKLSWSERREQEDKESRRANHVRAEMFAHGQPVAPYNTTQFLMDDHNDLQDLDVHLKKVTSTDATVRSLFQRPPRARDSSFSIDSEEDYFYSSPEDEEEFLTKEFSNTYEDLHAERLNNMPKSQLIQEYIHLEEKVDVLERRLKKTNSEKKEQSNESDSTEAEKSSEKMRLFQQEMGQLRVENQQLRLENVRLQHSYKEKAGSTVSVSSVDSESDSTSSSCDSASNGDSSDRGEALPVAVNSPSSPQDQM